MIAEGRVALDGKTLDTPATVLTSLHGVTVDGNPVKAPAPARLFRFHKPPGLLTAANDPHGRPTIYDRLPGDLPRVMPVGRLDLNTEGLLLMTTDGELKRALELPATGIERSYRARAYGDVTQAQLEDLIDGIEIEGVRYGSIDANLERRTGANVWIELTLTEGKNREVRRVLEHLGLKVSRLIRTRYGPFWLGDMPSGAVDEIRQHDVIAFRKALEGASGGKAASNLELAHRPYTAPVPRERGPASEPSARPVNRQARRAAAAEARDTPPPGKAAAGKGMRKPPARGARPAEAAARPMSSGGRSGARGADKTSASPAGKPASGERGTTSRRPDGDAAAKPQTRPARAGAPARGDRRPPREERDAGEPLLDRPARAPRPAADGARRAAHRKSKPRTRR